ncbi:MAG: 50S ribosomal protein L3 [Candidatus Omnitrophica bacterium]|nr:50S ribosomal protein L3 [Candidatus Omnitrophota bacterium]
MPDLSGKKLGMTHIYSESGKFLPVTVVEISESSLLKIGESIDVSGTSKGRGFQGGMKRWNWSGGPGGHGSTSHRRIGSIGPSTEPGRVWKGTHLPGHMGNRRVTIQNLKIVKIDKDNNLLAIKGAIPGHINSTVRIRKAKKKNDKI